MPLVVLTLAAFSVCKALELQRVGYPGDVLGCRSRAIRDVDTLGIQAIDWRGSIWRTNGAGLLAQALEIQALAGLADGVCVWTFLAADQTWSVRDPVAQSRSFGTVCDKSGSQCAPEWFPSFSFSDGG